MTYNYHIVYPEIEEYVMKRLKPEDPLLQELRKDTLEHVPNPQMMSGPQVGYLLQLLIKLSKATKILEIGMFTGYSALCMAQAMPEGGSLISCEIDSNIVNFAKQYFTRSKVGHKIDVRLGEALKTLNTLEGPYDLVFIDADKKNYLNYYKSVFPKVRVGGLIVLDNALRGGKVLHPEDEEAKAIDDVNRLIVEQSTVMNTLLTVRDGVNVVLKIAE